MTRTVCYAMFRAGADRIDFAQKFLRQKVERPPGVRLALEERLVQAELDLLNLLRSVYSAQADFFFATG